jgi:DNA-binding LytR/AlgR family response regulator
MKVVIIEDERHNSLMLETFLKNIRPEWEVIAVLDKVSSSVEWLSHNTAPDIIFMDIQLIDGICFSIFEKIEVESPIIFTTAYDEYAIRAFEVTSIDYLLKPIDEVKLTKAIEKFEKIRNIQSESSKPEINYNEIIAAIRKGEQKYRQRFIISGADSFSKVDVSDIAYFYSENNITFAVLFNGKEHVIDYTLEKLENQLDPEIFFRANRSAILSVKSIKKFENYFGGKLVVKLITPFKKSITISRLKASLFKQWLDN